MPLYRWLLMLDLEGTFRSRTPNETRAWIQPFLKQFGVTRIGDVTGLDSLGIYVYQAIRPLAKTLSTSQGKGTSRDLAWISAAMESIELWHGENIRPPDLYGSYEELSPSYPLSYPHPQNGKSREQLKLFWIQTTLLRTQKRVYVPYTQIHLDSCRPLDRSEFYTPSSNGLASGNTLEEALCHGLYEVIERDAWVKAQEGSLHERVVDLDTIECPYLHRMIAQMKEARIPFFLFDITSDLQIPSYTALFLTGGRIRPLPNSIGHGTHLSREVAASRAITEAAQCLITTISGAREDIAADSYRFTEEQRERQELLIQYLETRESGLPFIPTKSIPSTFSGCLDHLLDQLEEAKFKDVSYFNHTREEWGIPVVHVIVPRMKVLPH